MRDFNGDEMFEKIKTKIENGEEVTKQDLMGLVLVPLMKHKNGTAEVISDTINLSEKINDDEDKAQVQSMLYLLAEKFIKEHEKLNQIKERISMTRLGEMLFNDGVAKGKSEGEYTKAIEIANNLLKILSVEETAKATSLTLSDIIALKEGKNLAFN